MTRRVASTLGQGNTSGRKSDHLGVEGEALVGDGELAAVKANLVQLGHLDQMVGIGKGQVVPQHC